MNERILGREWVIEAQKLLLSLRDIAGASITLSEDSKSLSEINILAEGHRPPKQIVRDVRAALRAEYQVDVDYRKISVAQRQQEESPGGEGPTVLTLRAGQVEEEPTAHRFCFEGVTVGIDQASSQVRVELSLGGREAVGEASGYRSERAVNDLVARATLDAVGKFLDPGYGLALEALKVVPMGEAETALVSIKFIKGREDIVLAGSSVVRDGLQQAIVYATLDALNRVLGRLSYREPVEYEIRPTSIY